MSRKIRLKPASADAKRMRVRANGPLNITAKTLLEAFAPAPAKPTRTPKTRGPLTARTGIATAERSSSPNAPKPKKVWSVGKLQSGSVLHPKPRPWTRKPKSADDPLSKPKSTNDHLSKSKPKSPSVKPTKVSAKTSEAKSKSERSKRKKRKSPRILPYDGQPRFEAGIRIVQGGSPGLGKRK